MKIEIENKNNRRVVLIMKVVKILLGVALVLGLALGMTAPSSSFAANAPAKAQPNNNIQYGGMGLFMGQYFQGNMHEIIAEKLGIHRNLIVGKEKVGELMIIRREDQVQQNLVKQFIQSTNITIFLGTL